MNTPHRQPINLTTFLIAVLVIALIAVIVLAAVLADALISLIFGVFVLLTGVVVLARFGVDFFGRFTDSRYKMMSLRFDHVEHMARMGYTIEGSGYIPLQLPEPEPDMPVSLSGIQQSQLAEFRPLACELLALSIQQMGADSNQVTPFYKARTNDYFRDVAVWTNAVRFLLANRYAEEKYKDGKQGRKKVGTFLIAGTVRQAWERMRGDSPTG